MSLPVIETKLIAPALPPGHLSRPRIENQWAGKTEIRLVTVTAGAGWGKTSSLAAALQQEKRRVLWYSLDDADREPGVFMAHLAWAEGGSLSTDQEASFLSDLVNRWRADKRGTVLVLDDMQFLGPDSPVLDLIRRLVRYLPGRCTVVLSSREPVNLPTTKYRNQGEVVSLRARDLGFRREEISELFRLRFPGAVLTDAQLDGIVQHSEGWAAGLQIFFQILPGTDPDQLDQAVARLGAAGSGWFHYFAEEVVAGLDASIRNFLLRTSVLPRLEAGLCDQVLGRKDSGRVLAHLSHDNLFTFSTGEGDDCYRYHHLFQEFLLSSLMEQLGAEEVDRLRARVGKVLARSRQWAEAMGVLCRCRDTAKALRMIETHADDLLATGRFTDLGQALDILGAKMVGTSAEALYLLGNVQNIQGRWEQSEATYRRALRRNPSPARRVELQSLIAQLHMRGGKYESCLRLCRRAQKVKAKTTSLVRARMLGLQGVSCCALGRLEKGEAYLNEAVKICRRTRQRGGEGRNLFLLAANVHYLRGDFNLAEEAARKALGIFQDLDDRRLICHSFGVLGFVLIGAGRKTEGESYSRDALRRAESLGYRNIEGYCHLNLGECSLFAADPGSGEHHFQAARDIGHEIGEAALKSLALVGLAKVALCRENRPAARRLASAARESAARNQDLWPTAQAGLVLGLASIGKPRTAAKHWAEASRILTRLGARFELTRLQLWRLSENLTPEKDRPTRTRELMTQVAAGSYEFLLVDLEPQRARKVLAGIQSTDRMEDGLSEFTRRLAERLDPVVTRTENHLAVPLEIQALGPLRVTLGNRVLTFKDWKSGRAFRLFAFFLVHRFQWVVRDEILEALWPDADPVKASNNLRQTVHLLRKVLSPEGNCPYIQLRNDTYSLQGGADARCDVLEFKDALTRAQVCRREGREEEVVEALQQAMALYRGPFMMECPYEEFAENERDHLHFSHQRAAEKLLRQYRNTANWEEALTLCRQVLPLHPFHDFFHEILIRAHLQLGHRQEALDAYRQYEKRLAKDLDLLPSDSMRQLAEKAAGFGA